MEIDERVKNITTPKECEIFAKNATDRGRPDLAKQANERAIQLKAEAYGAETEAEKEAIAAVYAYEEVLTYKNKKKTRASRTWPMIKRHGIIEAVERAVNRGKETQGYNYLVEMGLQEYAFEAVVVRHSELFSSECVDISTQRISEWKNT
jgi:hypothetical protein